MRVLGIGAQADHKTAQTPGNTALIRLGLAKRQIEGADNESSPVNLLGRSLERFVVATRGSSSKADCGKAA